MIMKFRKSESRFLVIARLAISLSKNVISWGSFKYHVLSPSQEQSGEQLILLQSRIEEKIQRTHCFRLNLYKKSYYSE